jgi:hypothetical protein
VSESTDVETVEPIAEMPKLVHRGKYVLWEKPDGTLRIQYHRDDKEEEDFVEMPGQLVKLAKAAQEGKMNPMDMMKSMMKMMGGMPRP